MHRSCQIEVKKGNEEVTPKPSGKKPPGRSCGLDILVVDDQSNVRNSIALLLEVDRHEVTQADCGDNALQVLANQKFDLVISDYRMPGMNGDELARRIKALYPDLPVLMLTGFAAESMGSNNPVVAILHKPCHLSELREAITQATGPAKTPRS